RIDRRGIHVRLESTWRLLWDDQLHQEHSYEDPSTTLVLPQIGTRWAAALSMLGAGEYRFGRGITHIGCWGKHGRDKAELKAGNQGQPPTDLIALRYLRALVQQAVKSG